MKVGILGGTFDPPHLGHLELAKACVAHGLDLVLWIPNHQNPLKGVTIASADDRLEMVRLMIEDQPQMAVSDVEITREGPSFMVETIEELRAAQPDWDMWLILGADSLSSFLDWHYPERIIRMVKLAIAVRPGTDLDALIEEQIELIRDRLDLVEMDPFSASSTEIRGQLAAGEPAPSLHARVAEYIAEHGLYAKVP